jgi:hypothetical protein
MEDNAPFGRELERDGLDAPKERSKEELSRNSLDKDRTVSLMQEVITNGLDANGLEICNELSSSEDS